MLPILVRLSFESLASQLLLYGVALGMVGYIAWNGWRGAQGARTAQGTRAPVQRADRVQRAVLYGVEGVVLAGLGLKYALPASAFPGGKGEGIPVHTYGVLLALGFFCGVSVAARLARDEWRKVAWVDGQGFVDIEGPRRREQVLDMGLWVLVGGLLGSRILFILVNWRDYSKDWLSIFSLGGGLVFYGGLIGAAVAAYAFARRHGMDFLRLADVALPSVSLGQALGRLGCFSAGCCWGGPAGSHASLAVRFPGSGVAQDVLGHLTGTGSTAYSSQAGDMRYVVEATGEILQQAAPGAVRISEWVARHGTTLPVHPTQLFESLGQVVLFAGLLFLRRYRRFHGHIFSLWLMSYAVLRSTVELFRGDTERGTLHGLLTGAAPSLAGWVPLEAWYNISTSQFISLCMFTFGATLLLQRSRRLSGEAGMGPTPSPA